MPSLSATARLTPRGAGLLVAALVAASLARAAYAALPVEPAGSKNVVRGTAQRAGFAVPTSRAVGPVVVRLAGAAAGIDGDVEEDRGAKSEPASEGDAVVSYEGIFGTLLNPASPTLAAGPSHLLLAANSSLAVLDKATGDFVFGLTTFDSFFAPVLPADWRGVLFSPHAIFSPELEKFVLFTTSVDRETPQSSFFIAVSQTADALGAWWLYRYDNGFPEADGWVDLAHVGVDAFGFYVTGDFFRFSDRSFKHGVLWSFGPELAFGQLAPSSAFVDLRLPDGSPAAGLVPAVPHSISSELATFFVSARPAGGSDLTLWRLTGDRGRQPALEAVAVPVQSYRPVGHQVAQPGTEVRLDAGDVRIGGAVYAFRRLWATLASDPDGDGSSSGILTVELDTDHGERVWQDFLDPGDGAYFFYPSLTAHGGDGPELDLGLLMNATHRQDLPPSLASLVYRRDGSRLFRLVARGASAYTELGGLWGEYTSAGYDWSDPGRFWGYGTVGFSISDWRTRVVAVALSPGVGEALPPEPCVPGASTACLQGGRFQLQVVWEDFAEHSGLAQVLDGASSTSAVLWFFDETNWEVLAKVLDACAIDGHYWVFTAATTTAGMTTTVTDTSTGVRRVYRKAPGPPAPVHFDTTSFRCLP